MFPHYLSKGLFFPCWITLLSLMKINWPHLMEIYFWTFHYVPLIYMSVLMPKPHFLITYHYGKSSDFVFLFFIINKKFLCFHLKLLGLLNRIVIFIWQYWVCNPWTWLVIMVSPLLGLLLSAEFYSFQFKGLAHFAIFIPILTYLNIFLQYIKILMS